MKMLRAKLNQFDLLLLQKISINPNKNRTKKNLFNNIRDLAVHFHKINTNLINNIQSNKKLKNNISQNTLSIMSQIDKLN